MNYLIFGMGVFIGIFAGFWIVGILDSAKDEEIIVTYEPRKVRLDDFEPVGKVERRLRVLNGGKRG